MSTHQGNNNIQVFGETTFRNDNYKFGIKREDRRRHMYTIGKTGMGKSTLLENMIIRDIQAGEGVAVVDPHGDLAEKIIKYIPKNRVNDVIYFNPADTDYPPAFNVVEQVDPEEKYLVASGLVEVFRKLWADSWGPRLEYILRNAILAIMDYPSATLLSITKMLSDKQFRKKIVERVEDPVVRSFWEKEFAHYADKFATEAISPIQNKVGQFLSSSLIRNIVGQVRSSIDLRQTMDDGKILIMNLSKGRIGEDNSALLGAMMITKIQLAAMGRVSVPEEERRDFYLYIDEFQEFSTESFAGILAEARKYRLNLIMSHQYIEQLPDTVKAAIFGNIGTLISFRVGATDAEELVKEFSPTFMEEDLVNIPKYEMYLKLMIEGVASEPFSARGLPPLNKEDETGNAEKAIRVSRERYARQRSVVEDKIYRFQMDIDEKTDLGNNPSKNAATQSQPQKQNTGNEQQNNNNKNNSSSQEQKGQNKQSSRENLVKCYLCGKETSAPFKPDGIRPVYCKECLASIRQQKESEEEERKRKKEEELKWLEEKKKQEKNGKENKGDIKKEAPSEKQEKSEQSSSRSQAEEISLQEAMKMEPVKFNNNSNNKKNSKKEGQNKKSENDLNRGQKENNTVEKKKETSSPSEEGTLKEDKDIYF